MRAVRCLVMSELSFFAPNLFARGAPNRAYMSVNLWVRDGFWVIHRVRIRVGVRVAVGV